MGYLQDRFPAMGNDPAGNINQSSAYLAGIGAGRQHRGADVFLERLKKRTEGSKDTGEVFTFDISNCTGFVRIYLSAID